MAERRYRPGQAPRGLGLKTILLKAYRIIAQPRVVRRDRFVVADETDSCANPIFLLGLHRSGTTLLRQIVDTHSRIACPPETLFLYYLARAIDDDQFFLGLDNMGFDRQGAMAGLRRSAAFYYDTYRRSKGKPRWADKTPIYFLVLPFIEEMFGPGCQYVVLYRHPFDVIQSLLAKGWDFMKYHDDRFMNLVLYVKDGLTRLDEFAAAHADRCHVLHYEKLAAEPEPRLRELFRFLGEPWEAEVMQFNSKPHDFGTGDAEAQLLRGFRPSTGNWGNWSAAHVEQALEAVGPIMERLGYSARVADYRSA